MLIDTHCHLNMMVKKDFDRLITKKEITQAGDIVQQAYDHQVRYIINVGTSFEESKNCITLSKEYEQVYAVIGLHPNDCNENWRKQIKEFGPLLEQKDVLKIVGVGETGIDRHYKGYNLQRQYDAFKGQIELALHYDIALVVHSRDAYDETLQILDEYSRNSLRAVIHCFSYDQNFADQVISWGFKLGIGGTITYPNNNELRAVVRAINLSDFVLETDAPFLPPQSMRGQKNSPKEIQTIAQYISELRNDSFENIAMQTTSNAKLIFRL